MFGSDNGYVNCIQTFFAIFYFEGNLIVFPDPGTLKVGNMDKNVGAAVVGFNEAKSLGLIEEFYCTFLHCVQMK